MKISKKSWISFFILAVISFAVWFQFSYPQLAFLNLQINKDHASKIANQYLQSKGINPSSYYSAIKFETADSADRFLQKTLGFSQLNKFVHAEEFDMFYWKVRFFRENEKEEFRINVSSKTGEVILFKHIIDDQAAFAVIERDTAKNIAEDFLVKNFNFNPENYILRDDIVTKLDNRIDYAFSWQKKDVNIAWDEEKDAGTGKLIYSVVVTGKGVRAFSKNDFLVPDQFQRYIRNILSVGKNISSVINIFYFLIVCASVYFIVGRRNHLAMHKTKFFLIGLLIFFFILSILSNLNNWQVFLFKFSTTSTLKSYILQLSSSAFMGAIFISIVLLIPYLSGELLHFEEFPQKTNGSFLYYLQTTFFSREVTQNIVLGYFIFIIMLGLQSVLFKFGQTYLGVWIEYNWMTQLTSAFIPVLATFTVSFKAAVSEEITFRLFAISWFKKVFKNIPLACLISALIWGFAHSNYQIFPMWFRGIEVGILGLFLGGIYLNYGLITVIVAHYLFDVFWHGAGYLLGSAAPLYFYSTLIVFLLPLLWALAAFIINKPIILKELRWHLNKHQLFNLEVLKHFLRSNPDLFALKTTEQLKDEICHHGWDVAVVEVALEDIEKEKI
ncbi:MAG: CPBP family intramembrane metalloprotease [Candidatus Omnitrophica bacterium]|nr:CPBP family intramembrane metalloprotease [Candidatus Omnitrophota bacterium]MCB9748211.1 CPBP family intramembrane metalloprotease [Candidatus Omnitrophota bacterium]